MKILHVCTGRARPLGTGAGAELSAIAKTAVDGPLAVAPLGLAGDEQADLVRHGGLSKAVYAYPSEHLPFWTGLSPAWTQFEETARVPKVKVSCKTYQVLGAHQGETGAPR